MANNLRSLALAEVLMSFETEERLRRIRAFENWSVSEANEALGIKFDLAEYQLAVDTNERANTLWLPRSLAFQERIGKEIYPVKRPTITTGLTKALGPLLGEKSRRSRDGISFITSTANWYVAT